MVKSTRSGKSESSSVSNLENSMVSSGASNDGAVSHNIPDFSTGHGPQTQIKYRGKYKFPHDLPKYIHKFNDQENKWNKHDREFPFHMEQLFNVDLQLQSKPNNLSKENLLKARFRSELVSDISNPDLQQQTISVSALQLT